MLAFVRTQLPTVQGRLTAGLALVVAIVVGLWPDHPRPFDVVRAGAILTTAVAWLFAEISSANAVSEHDKGLFSLFRETVKEADKDFLREQDFHFSFVYMKSAGLREMAYWTGAAYEFVDDKIESKWAPLIKEVDAFVGMMAQYAAPVGGNTLLMTVHPTQGDPDDPKPWVLDEIAKLNSAARKLYANLNDFERFARKRLAL